MSLADAFGMDSRLWNNQVLKNVGGKTSANLRASQVWGSCPGISHLKPSLENFVEHRPSRKPEQTHSPSCPNLPSKFCVCLTLKAQTVGIPNPQVLNPKPVLFTMPPPWTRTGCRRAGSGKIRKPVRRCSPSQGYEVSLGLRVVGQPLSSMV